MQNTAESIETNPHTTPNRIDTMQALKMRFKNKNTYQEIADYFGVSKPAVHEHIQRVIAHIDDPEIVEQYEKNKAEILSSVERQLVAQLLDRDKIEKASLNNVAYAYAQVANQNRLQRGQATEIQGYSEIIRQEKHVDSEIERLRKMLIDPGTDAQRVSSDDELSECQIVNAVDNENIP